MVKLLVADHPNIQEALVTIVTPVFNSAEVLPSTFDSVMRQKYTNWRWILVNDGSTDASLSVLRELAQMDSRLQIINLPENVGAAQARNEGVRLAASPFIAFLDADDLWHEEKLARQLQFMKERDASFTFTAYEFANEQGLPDGRIVRAPALVNYRRALTNSPIWTSTVIFDLRKLSKETIRMPNVRRGQDTATWWQVLKQIDYAYGLDEVLSYYRTRKGSLSSNPLTSLQRTWRLYREVERFGVIRSSWYYVQFIATAVRKRLPRPSRR